MLRVWLGTVPDYAVAFSQLNLSIALLTSMFILLNFTIYATGKIRSYTLTSGILYLLILPISFFLLQRGMSPVVPFIVNFILSIISCINNLRILNFLVPAFSAMRFLCHSVFVSFSVLLLSSFLPLTLHFVLEESWIRFLLIVVSSTSMICGFGYWIALDKDMRKKVSVFILNKFKNSGHSKVNL